MSRFAPSLLQVCVFGRERDSERARACVHPLSLSPTHHTHIHVRSLSLLCCSFSLSLSLSLFLSLSLSPSLSLSLSLSLSHTHTHTHTHTHSVSVFVTSCLSCVHIHVCFPIKDEELFRNARIESELASQPTLLLNLVPGDSHICLILCTHRLIKVT